MTKPTIEFFYEFASTYSYLSAMRIEALAEDAGVAVAWRPFLLGPIFKAQGWNTSPFNLYPAKGRYMVRDIERIAASRGLTFKLPDPFPANGLHAARLALAGLGEGWTPAFTKAVYCAEFQRGANIAEPDVLAACLREVGADVASAIEAAASQPIKDQLRANTDAAIRREMFGAPTFATADGELFWGDDRLDCAIEWARTAAA
jgi:2-hydroxychromene-2-carboxylate isomerase